MQVGHGCFHIHHHVEMAGFILIGLIGETMQEQFKSASDGLFHLHRLGQSNLHGCFDHDDGSQTAPNGHFTIIVKWLVVFR